MAKPTSLSSSSFAYQWTYDVFLSFRGEDTRTGFTGSLYHALREKGIKTFMDDQGLSKGEEITPALMKGIEESRIAIVIFSENYASSTFCLEELVKIMECLKHKGRLVWPVFYKVEPCDVRHQKGSYAEALAKHETRVSDKDKVEKWRLALQEAASLSGWHSTRYKFDINIIQEIIQEVSKRINNPLDVAKYPVGLETRVQKVKSLLDVESNEGVHMVGIYGIGGIGKTTLVCAVYNFVAYQFEGLSFLFDVREKSRKHGLVHLQKILLSDILQEKDIELRNVKEGSPMIKSKLCKKKILLILDDVDKSEQLDALAGRLDWFGSGSRIIITTRDTHLLRSRHVDRTYEVEGLNDKEALELFSWNASGTKQVDSSYLDISKRVVGYSNGHPLSLEIIGSALIGKSESVWMSALDGYEETPHENIQESLRVSYDGLTELQKQIFLDLACFFIGYKLTDVIDILRSGYGIAPDYAIEVLIDKCLIKIVQHHLRMHNLIEDMGKEIVRQESPSKPGKCRRLFSEDIVHVFEENKGSDKTQIIMLDLPKDKVVHWDGNALEKMENLKILLVKNARFSRGPSALPKSLRVLIWCGYPESSLPAQFDPMKLVILDLSHSLFTFKNQLNMKFMSLRKLKLSGCKLLKEVPDLSGAPKLEQLHLDNCKELREIKGLPPNIKYLSAFRCKLLTSQSKEMLMNKTLHETGGKHFLFPGSTIPSWFNLSSRGPRPTLRFWFRHNFPAINLCVVGDYGMLSECKLDVFLNGLQQCPEITIYGPGCCFVGTNHTILYDLQLKFEESKSAAHTHLENGWNGVEISFEGEKSIEWIGVHVPEQKTNMEDIQFTNPDPSMLEKQWLIRLSTVTPHYYYTSIEDPNSCAVM